MWHPKTHESKASTYTVASSLSASSPGSAVLFSSSSESSGNAAISATRLGPLTGTPAALHRVRTLWTRASGVAVWPPDLDACSSSYLRAEIILRNATASWKHITYIRHLFNSSILRADCHLSSEERRRQLRSADSRTCVVRRTYSNFGYRCFTVAGPMLCWS